MKELKPFIISLIIIAAGYASIAYAAPYFRQEAGLVPVTDSEYYIGTTTPATKAWAGVITDQLCLTADTCITSWPSAGADFAWTPTSYGVSTTTTVGFLNGLFSTASSTFSHLLWGNATGTSATTTNFFSTTASSTNLFASFFTLAGNTLSLSSNATVGGTNSGDVTLAGTPDYITISGQTITRGTIDISDDTNLTAGDALTLTGDDIDFDGGATPSGDLGGTWASPSVTNDSHDHTGATLSGIDISDDTNLTAGDHLTLTGDDLDVDDDFLLNTGDSGTGAYDFGGADSFEIPNGTSPTFSAVGQIGWDTTSGNLRVATSSAGATVVVGSATTTLYAFSVASTSPDFVNGGVIRMPSYHLPQIATAIVCVADAGTSFQITLSDSSNTTNTITCTTTETQFALTSNNSWNAYERIQANIGTISGAVDYGVIRILGYRQSD